MHFVFKCTVFYAFDQQIEKVLYALIFLKTVLKFDFKCSIINKIELLCSVKNVYFNMVTPIQTVGGLL